LLDIGDSLGNSGNNTVNTEEQTTVADPSAVALVKVAIVEDQRKFREALSAIIEGTEGFRCAGSFRSMEEALDKIGRDLPEVVLVDIGLPGMSGIEGISLLKQRYPQLILLVHTVYEDDERIFDALCAGASGYLLKRTPPARLLENLREAAGGGAPMTPEIASRVVSLFREYHPPNRNYDLSPHELRILKLLMNGHNYKTAAAELDVTTHTISFHLQKIYEKLHVNSKTEAVAKALQNRLIK
jgi:DNA-binding NarL/FixJ family response regulator